MTTRYISKCKVIGLEYQNGILKEVTIFHEDRVSWDGYRHDIELYEDELNLNDWIAC